MSDKTFGCSSGRRGRSVRRRQSSCRDAQNSLGGSRSTNRRDDRRQAYRAGDSHRDQQRRPSVRANVSTRQPRHIHHPPSLYRPVKSKTFQVYLMTVSDSGIARNFNWGRGASFPFPSPSLSSLPLLTPLFPSPVLSSSPPFP